MEPHFSLSDLEFETQLQNATLDPKLFSHEAHLRLAYIHLKTYGLELAIETICQHIKNYVGLLGAMERFNMTLTVAAVRAVHHFMSKSTATHFKDFILAFPRLKSHFKELMGFHYSFDIYENPKAKASYLAPDLLPFD
ncbi:MAG: hypothetical protein AAGB24_04605 [Bacteroidota bacterium]